MSMKDLLNKMTELQGTTKEEKVTTTGKKILNESTKPVVKESTKPSLKSMFNALLAEAEQVTIQPAKQNTQVIKQGDKTLGTVENPQLAQQIKQSIGKGEMNLAGDDLQEDDMSEGLDPAQKQKLKSLIYAYRDATDPEGYSDEDPDEIIDQIRQEFGDKIADTISQGPSMHYPRPGHVSGVYDPLANKSSPRVTKSGKINKQDSEFMKRNIKQQLGMNEAKLTEKAKSKSQQQAAGAALAAKRGDAPKSTLKGASKEMAKMPAKELEKFAKTKHKGLPDKKQKTDEAAMPTHDGDFGAGLGAGRNSKTLEAKKAKPDFLDLDKDGNKKESMKKAAADKQKVSTMKKTNEAKAKPDFLDLDKDGNKKEPMKKAAADKKTGSTDKKSSAGLTAAQKKLPAGLQKAVAKKKTVKEGTNPTESARLLGKAHAMANDTFSCKYEEGSQEAQAYLDGYKSGLDECYGLGSGMGMQQDIGMMPGMDSMVSMNDTSSLRGGSDFEVDSMDDMGGFGGFDGQSDEFMEANSDWDSEFDARPKDWKPTSNQAFDASKRALGIANRLPKDQRDKWNSRTMSQMNKFRAEKDKTFEAWDRELNALLNEGKMKDIDIDMQEMSDAEFKKEHGKSKADMKKDLSYDKKPVKEGISVSVSKGQQGEPDSVTVSAQDQDADALLAMIKQAGLGLFGGDEPSGYGSPVSVATQPTGDVGDHDSMMNLIKKMSSTGNDYEDEESMSCDTCDDESDSKALVVGEEQGYDDKEDESLGMRTGKESDKEQSMKDRRDDSYGKFGKRTDEDETEDQMEFEVAESNAPDSDEAETTADENAEAEEDKALAGADSGDEEEIDEGSCSMDEEEELTEWANDAGYQGSENMKDNTFEQDIDFMTRVISGGLNGQKQDQTTLPHTKVKVAESSLLDEWKKLSGIK